MESLLDPALDPLFWDNLRGTTQSAWHGHVPFAHWIVPALKPRVFVELGSHAGVSYAAFCQSVQRSGLGTQCFAVDSWAGDDHAGAYSEEVYEELRAFHDPRFGGFSRMIRKTFDDAVGDFADGSIDLLHIDGFHSYEAVSHDFHTWNPKLSDRAVVLFHDTNVRERGFGVWKFWDEIRGEGLGSFEFLHAFGLGVLVLGSNAPEALRQFCKAPVERLRQRFETLGRLQILQYERAHAPATVPEPAETAEPKVDPSLDPGDIFIAERFVAAPTLHALRLPRDAVARSAAGCTVWVVDATGQDWRQGHVAAAPETDTVTLGFAPFGNTRPRHFSVFVTGPCAEGTGLPPALAGLLANRRPPIALDTPDIPLPDLPAHGLFVLRDGIVTGLPSA